MIDDHFKSTLARVRTVTGPSKPGFQQRAVAMILEPICEQEFLPFSFGFRPGAFAASGAGKFGVLVLKCVR